MALYEERESYAASRSGGIGGTDCAAILGLSPWKKPIDIFAAKMKPMEQPELDKECLYWGTALEPVIRGRYAVKYGVQVTDPKDLGALFPKSRQWGDSTLIEGAESWQLAAPDGVIRATKTGLEIKNSSRRGDEWGPEGTDEIPPHYLIQAAWYMAVTNAKAWDFGVLFSGNKLERFTVQRDPILEASMIEACRDFWFSYVQKGIEPPIDESESYGRYLAKKFSLNTGVVIKNPSEEFLGWTQTMFQADQAIKQAEEDKQRARNYLASLLGDAKAAETPLGKVGWVRPEKKPVLDKDGAIADLCALYDDARAQDAKSSAEVLESNLHPKQNDAYLRSWWKK